MQSRFVTLKDPSRRVIRFDDLARNNDPTRINEQMVVTLDAQLFYSVLSALPYLVNYPYECTEQTLTVLSRQEFSHPCTGNTLRLTGWQRNSLPARHSSSSGMRKIRIGKMALEETPWLQMAKGGDANASDLINVLDARIAKAQRESALAKLRSPRLQAADSRGSPEGLLPPT